MSAGNGQLSPVLASRFKVNRTVDGATPTRRAISLSPTPAVLKPSTSRTWRITVLSAVIPSPVQKPKEGTLIGPAEAPFNRATSSRIGGRNHLGTPGEIKSEWWATSSRIRGRHPPESAVLTDVATGWTECAPLLVREQRLLTEVLDELRKLLPFPLLGLDTDNDSVFMNETVRDYCQQAGIEFTRCRPYRKNDQAWVEQKNGAVVRRTIGYRRFEGLEAAAALARLYAAMRLFVNFFQPSFKLAAKTRDGALVRKRYHPPATPCQRLLADPRTNEEVRRRVHELRASLDPVRLLQQIRAIQQRLVDIADRPALGETAKPTSPTLEEFLSSLRTAWKDGGGRPTIIAKAKPKRSRRRPDPFAAVTTELREWFETEPWHTSRELFERLQAQ